MEKIKKLSLLPDEDISDMSSKEQTRLMNQMRDVISDTKVQLQTCQEQRKSIDQDIERWLSDRDRLMPLVTQAAKHGRVLKELDVERERAVVLSRQVEEQEAALSSSRVSEDYDMKEMRQKESSLLEEEKRLIQQCNQTRKSLARVQSRCLAVEEELQRLQSQGARGTSSQSQHRMQDQLVDEYVAKLGIRDTLLKAGVSGSKRHGRVKEQKPQDPKDLSVDNVGHQSSNLTGTKPKRSRKAAK
ncbi:hypothetical protein AGOR_G00059970 [Albula goreensis]|uniref:Uncharacterized protein n=1 Tax=Albula goreensis TaxID=1534307 RepID=A0A8T3DP77_9TELE|nr:hypothetical protein AGOR_G00059970 [Albula goreensis]